VVARDWQPVNVEPIEVERLLFAQLAGAPARRRSETRLSGGAAFGEDLHDAVVGARAVKSRRRRSADDLDVLDVVRIEISETVLRIGAGTEISKLPRLVVDGDSVGAVESIGAGVECVGAERSDGDSTTAGPAGVVREFHPG